MVTGQEANAIARVDTALASSDLANIASFDDAMSLVGEKLGGVVLDASDLGDGFAVLENKDALCGVPLVVLQSVMRMGNHGEYVSMHVVTKDGRKLIVNDGSTGIRDQITMLWERRPEVIGRPMVCTKGLRKSTYTRNVDGQDTQATTYYLDTSA